LPVVHLLDVTFADKLFSLKALLVDKDLSRP
jgi:hypothetical protein